MFRDRAAAGPDGAVLVKIFLQAMLAILVIGGWIAVSIWMITSVIQIGVVQQSTSCTVDAALDVSCHR